MAILDEDIARVRQASDLVALVSEHVGLKKVGRRWMGLCPFHAENSPSFSVNGEEGLFYCFGCQKKGDVITFVREVDHLDFSETVERLAARAGIELRYDTNAAGKDRKHRAALTAAMERAVDWYSERLLSSPDASAARAYLRERGYDGKIVRQFRIGWAPSGWDELSRALKLPPPVLKETGLGFLSKRGTLIDAFRGRIVFPIFDSSGSPVAFGGRILPGGDPPKYKNSSETPLYSKSRTLYGLNWAKDDVVRNEEVIVCEGYTDVIGFFLAGVPRAVATCGTALTEDHVRILKNFAKRVVLAYDADAAGQAAAERFYEWERKLGIDIAVAAFPRGTDPADAARRNPELVRSAVASAQPYLAFRLLRLYAESDFKSVEGRARVAQRGMSMIAEHPDELVRDQYLMELADRCRVPAQQLRTALQGGGAVAPERSSRRVVDIRAGRKMEGDVSAAEWEALRALVLKPEEVGAMFSSMAAFTDLTGVEEHLFRDHRAAAAFRAFVEAPSLRDAIDHAEPEASELLARLAMEEDDEAAPEAFLRLIDEAAQRAVRELEVQARLSENGIAVAGPTIAWLKLTIERLRSQDVSAAGDLVNWLNSELEAS